MGRRAGSPGRPGTIAPPIARDLVVEIVRRGGAWRQLGAIATLIRRAARVAAAAAPGRATITAPCRRVVVIALADDALMRTLNRDFRSQDRATNVLSFPAAPEPHRPAGASAHLGDVILGYETLMREAEERGVKAADHLQHLVVHGVLHLLGYDHVVDREAQVMEALETAILARFGIRDPYADH